MTPQELDTWLELVAWVVGCLVFLWATRRRR